MSRDYINVNEHKIGGPLSLSNYLILEETCRNTPLPSTLEGVNLAKLIQTLIDQLFSTLSSISNEIHDILIQSITGIHFNVIGALS